MTNHLTRLVVQLGAILVLAACAHTEVARWASPPGKEVVIGQRGAVETVKQGNREIDVWVQGSPNRPFKILAKTTSTYRHGLADKQLTRDAAKRQMIDAVVVAGGDAVVFGSEAIASVGTVYMPGTQTTYVQPAPAGAFTANTYSSPMVGGSIDEGTRLFPRLRLGKEVLLRRTAED